MFFSLVIIIKNFNSINSRRPWPSIFDFIFFSMVFFRFLGTTFYTRGVLVGIELTAIKMVTSSGYNYSILN